MPPSAVARATRAATLSGPNGLRAAGGGGEEGSPEADEDSEAAAAATEGDDSEAAAAAAEGEDAAAAAAGEAVEKERAEILGRRCDLAMRDMAWLARGVRNAGIGVCFVWLARRV